MIYDIRHLTTYQYGSTVTYSNCALRLLPRDEPGQVVYASRLEIEPPPATTVERFCFFGNRVTSMTVETAHRSLKVSARTSVEIDRAAPPAADATPAWDVAREEGFASRSLGPDSPAHFLHPSRFVPHYAPAADYTRESFRPAARCSPAPST